MDKDLVNQVVDVAQRVVASGAISANGHGNVSIRVPGADEITSLLVRRLETMFRRLSYECALTEPSSKASCPPSRVPWLQCTRLCMRTIPTLDACCTPIRHMPRPTPLLIDQLGAGSKPWRCSVCRPECRSPVMGHAVPTKQWLTSELRSSRGYQRYFYPTMECLCFTAPQNWPSWLAGSSRRLLRLASMLPVLVAQSRFPKNFGPRLFSEP